MLGSFAVAFSQNAAATTAAASTESAKPDLGALPEWNLADLYAAMDSPAYAADLERADRQAQDFAERYRGKLADLLRNSGAELAEAISGYEALDELISRILSYAGLLYAADTADPARAKFYGDAQEKMTNASSPLVFFALELNRLDDQALEQAMQNAPLAHYRPWIEDVRREKPHQLEDRIELLFHEKSITGRGAWNRLFDETLTGLRFDVEGESLSLEPTLSLLQDPNEERRKEASQALSTTLEANLRTFALITNTLAKDKEISDRWRKFQDIADDRHLSNRVEREIVEALVSAVRDAYPRLSHRYYRLKAKWFGREQLATWDRNAPLPNVATHVYKWDEARDIVLAAYGEFAPPMAAIAERFFDHRWIDAPVRPGKSPGAFAHPTVPAVHPYVLLNYQGRPRDVMTLAHELGHGVHQVLAAPNGALMAPTPLTLAETASVFGEMLTFQRLVGAAGAPARRALLAAKVEDMLNTVVRQIAFYTFERKVHTARRVSELTAEEIGELWLSVQAESFGPAIRIDPGYEVFWAYIPHFVHSPFYVYAYAFGDCLVNSLYGVYQGSREGFAERYFKMLAAGGTKHHSELLAPFGLDAHDPGFWQIGLSVISGMIDDLEAMEDNPA